MQHIHAVATFIANRLLTTYQYVKVPLRTGTRCFHYYFRDSGTHILNHEQYTRPAAGSLLRHDGHSLHRAGGTATPQTTRMVVQPRQLVKDADAQFSTNQGPECTANKAAPHD